MLKVYNDRLFTKEDIVNFIALIVNRNNPNIDRIIDDFDEFIGFFNHKPE